MTSLPILTNLKKDNYDTFSVIIDYLTMIVNYELIKTTIDAANLAEIIINIVPRHYDSSKLIFCNKDLLFIFKFWFLLYHFFDIKQKLSTTFHPQIDAQTEKWNSTMKIYLRIFVN